MQESASERLLLADILAGWKQSIGPLLVRLQRLFSKKSSFCQSSLLICKKYFSQISISIVSDKEVKSPKKFITNTPLFDENSQLRH